MAVQGSPPLDAPAATIEDMTDIDTEHRRTAQCECGAQFAGNSRRELYEAAQSHIAHHHPELLGAVGADLVNEMSHVRPGAVSA